MCINPDTPVQDPGPKSLTVLQECFDNSERLNSNIYAVQKSAYI